MNTKVKRILPFPYMGSKVRQLEWIYALFPDETEYDHYCEPFCGSLSVLLNKRPAMIETASDKSGRLINFFRVLRQQRDEFIETLMLTPYSRQEFLDAFNEADTPIEDARRFFIRCVMGFGGAAHTERRKHSWRSTRVFSHDGENRLPIKWMKKVEGLWDVYDRLRMVQFENRDYDYIIEKYDNARTFFYLDPPYPFESRTGNRDYNHEMTDNDHKELRTALDNIKGMVAISGYECPLMEELYGDWNKWHGPSRSSNMGKRIVKEMLWTNYLPASQMTLF